MNKLFLLLAFSVCINVACFVIIGVENETIENIGQKNIRLQTAVLQRVDDLNYNLRSYQLDIYDEGGTNDSMRVYDRDRLVGKIYMGDSTQLLNVMLWIDND